MNYESYSELAKVYKDSVSEYFDSFDGTWRNYAAFGEAISQSLIEQKHINIRSFDIDTNYTYKTVFDLSNYSIGSLKTNNVTVDSLKALSLVVGENWQTGSTAVQTDQVKDSFLGINVNCPSGATTVIQSIYKAIDISTLNQSTSKIIVTLPDFSSNVNLNSSYIDISSSTSFDDAKTNKLLFNTYIKSALSGTNRQLEIPLSALTNVTLSSIVGIKFRIFANSQCNFKCIGIKAVAADWTYAPVDIDTINQRLCKTVPIYASGTDAFPVYGDIPGTLPKNWPVLQRAFSSNLQNSQDPKILNGEFNVFIDLGDPANSVSTQNNPNIFSIYFNIKRKSPTQLELTAPSGKSAKTQADLTLNKINPSSLYKEKELSNQALYSVIPSAAPNGNQLNPKNRSPQPGDLQKDLSKIPSSAPDGNQLSLNPIISPQPGLTQSQLNYVDNVLDADYLNVSLVWFKNGSQFLVSAKIINSNEEIYTFTIPYNFIVAGETDRTKIIFAPKMEDDYIQIKIYKLNKYNQINLIYESEKIFNSFYFTRSRNRIGWYATLVDGDHFVNSVRSGGLVYAEYRAQTMKSRTPLKGLNLFADYSNDINLLNDIIIKQSGSVTTNSKILNVTSTSGLLANDRIYGEGIPLNTKIESIASPTQIILNQVATVAKDKSIVVNKNIDILGAATLSDDYDKISNEVSTKITIEKNSQLSGIITDAFSIEDPDDVIINLDLWYPSYDSDLIFALFDKQGTPLFNLEPDFYRRDQWQNIHINIPKNEFACGSYKLAIFQSVSNSVTNWWIKNFTIKRKLITWEARSELNRLSGYQSQSWIKMKSNVNRSNDGTFFQNKGVELQYRAKAKSHYALIHNIKIVPQYATSGNFVWREE